MNPVLIGRFIEGEIKHQFKLHESKIGFDAFYNGLEIEIKACTPTHKNGLNPNGKDRITKGRFWIENRAHRLLLEEKGLYIFVLYVRHNEDVVILRTLKIRASKINRMITEGDNTKVRYDLIFPDYQPEAV